MRRFIVIQTVLFTLFTGLPSAGAADPEPLRPDYSTPDEAVKTVLSAIYHEDAAAFVNSFSGKYVQNLTRPEKFNEATIRSYLSGASSRFRVDDYRILDILEAGNKARVEIGMRDPSAVTDILKAAYILEKEESGWKVVGRDFLRKEDRGWEYTRPSDRFTLIRKL